MGSPVALGPPAVAPPFRGAKPYCFGAGAGDGGTGCAGAGAADAGAAAGPDVGAEAGAEDGADAGFDAGEVANCVVDGAVDVAGPDAGNLSSAACGAPSSTGRRRSSSLFNRSTAWSFSGWGTFRSLTRFWYCSF